jgi:hypothetical protein
MIRTSAALAFLALAPAAFPQEQPQPEQPQPVDTAALEGKVASLEEQMVELKGNVDALRKLRFSGYVQARWEWNEAASAYYNTTPADAPAQNGFHIRRGRFKAVYDADWSQYVLQIDVVPAGVSIKEGYATIKLPKDFAIDAGLQLFPFGYEVYSRSSSDLDTLERARVTRAFLGGEYDLGVALRGKLGIVNFKVGVFNGNGIDSGQSGRDNDQLKDLIGRATVDLGTITAGVSGWYGKTINYARDDDKDYPRVRYGADLQLFLDLVPIGGTALKGEYIWGQTTIGTAGATATPPQPNGGAGANLPSLTSPDPVPTGSGWYVILTQNLLDHWQLAGRYEQYMPDHTVDTGSSSTAVKVQEEVQVALHTFIGGNLKLTGAWFHPMNGDKGGAAPGDPKADRWIVQAQAKF